MVASRAGFRTPESRDHPHGEVTGVRKAPRREFAGWERGGESEGIYRRPGTLRAPPAQSLSNLLPHPLVAAPRSDLTSTRYGTACGSSRTFRRVISESGWGVRDLP
jgi:hypothetical protein